MKIDPNVNPRLSFVTRQIDDLKRQVKITNGHDSRKVNWITRILELQTERIELKRIKKMLFGSIVLGILSKVIQNGKN